MSVWQSVQPNALWTEPLNLASSTCRLTGLPFSSLVRVGSLWQARQSSLLILGAVLAAATVTSSVTTRNSRLQRFTETLTFKQRATRAGNLPPSLNAATRGSECTHVGV